MSDVAAWSNGYIAVGSAWDSPYQVKLERPALWTSEDGRAWEDRPIDLGVDDVTLLGIAPRVDGRLLLVGVIPGSGSQAGPTPAARSVAWTSSDGASWDAIEFPIPETPVARLFEAGAKGYTILAGDVLWYSAGGIEWTESRAGTDVVAAGDDGFVASTTDGSAIASADGRTWYAATPTSVPLVNFAAVGGDWVALGDTTPKTVWHSPNGLDWERVADVNDLIGRDPTAGGGISMIQIYLVGGAGRAFLTVGDNHCCAQMGWSLGVWATTDGTTWERVIAGDAHVSSVAAGRDGSVVVGGHLGRGEDAAFWADS